ncbi:MAG: PAS domain S-box protein [Syntrophales bacterium]|nr:PAS domain S-box protein [Syntrophales bacterium]
MQDQRATNQQLSDVLAAANRRIAELEQTLAELRLNDEANRKAILRYRHIIDNVDDGIFELKSDGTFSFVNKVIVDRLGIPEEAFSSLHFSDTLIPEDRDRAAAAFGRILAGETVPPNEVRRRAVDGQIVPFELNVIPIHDGGRIIGVRGVTRNLTERKRMEAEIVLLNENLERRVIERTAQLEAQIEERIKAENALTQSEEKFRNFMENSPIGLCITDLSGHVQFINRKIEEVSGWTREELTGRDALTVGIFDDETKRALLERLAARLRGDAPRTTEIALTCKNGSRLWVDLKTTVLYEDGLPTRLQLAFINVTDQKQAEAALREGEAKYRELVGFLPLPLFEIDRNGDITSGNPAIFDTFGYTPEDLAQGLNAFRMIVPQDRDRAIATMNSIFQGKKTGGTEYTAIRKDGQTFPVAIFAGPIIRDHTPMGLRGAIIDLTRQKQAEHDLQQARDLLLQTEKLASIGRLSAGVAHEILNPVNIISMELQIMQDMADLTPTMATELYVCRNQIKRIVDIAESLKQFSRIPSKKMSQNNLHNLIDQVLALYGPQFSLEGVKVDVQYQPDLPAFYMDREKIEQVILNLITNAVYAMKATQEKVLRIRTSWNKSAGGRGSVRVMIGDNGAGIRDEDIPKLFEPFFTTKDYGEGTGLGLSISYGIIDHHGGKIWAENNEWGGASFFFELPVNIEG